MNIPVRHIKLWALFGGVVCCNVLFWFSVREQKVQWLNVPPTPGLNTALWSSLGDPQLAYRSYGITIQNMGDTGGRVTSLADYDYDALGQWFHLQHELDPNSDFTPFIAGHFFAASKATEKLAPLVDYLERAALDGQGEKWRWMAKAAYIARFKMNDLDRALELAHKLAALDNPDMPLWAKSMPTFVMLAQGEKEAAYIMAVNLLKSSADSLHPNEVNATLDVICTRILDEAQAAQDPLCKDRE